ncbi:unnamed protein product [Mytilus edulis]|uniref:Uncharacterized protein n=1 Tax=Mytilus edulis TaxID=6550 RepID=A0A8S3UNG7_MYTED|nr:unnamed protein product [Mytilus edulis]
MEYSEKTSSSQDTYSDDGNIPPQKRTRRKAETGSRVKRKRRAVRHDIDTPFITTSPGQAHFLIPCSTSDWNTCHLESLRIYFENAPKPISVLLDKVYQNTGMFGPLNEEQLRCVEKQQDSMLFSTSLSDVMNYASEYYHYSNKHCDSRSYEEIITELDRVSHLQKQGQSLDQVVYLLNHIMMIIQKMRSSLKTLPKSGFKDLFKIFIQLSGLFASDGKLWKADRIILRDHEVISEADVAITSVGTDQEEFDDISALVSIVEVDNHDNLTSINIKQQEIKSLSKLASDSSDSLVSEGPVLVMPPICNWISSNVLGQHGGELLIHFDKFAGILTQKDFFYRPGMILFGTKVVFTLLVCSKKHWMEITDTDSVKKGTSFISYSEPKDLLIKEDRDELLESIARLNNIC